MKKPMPRLRGWPEFILVARALTIGMAYYLVRDIPGLTSSFVSILVSVLMFDVFVAMEKIQVGRRLVLQVIALIWPRARGTAATLIQGLAIGLVFGILYQFGLPKLLAAALTGGLAYTWAESTKGRTSTYVGLIGGLTVFQSITLLGRHLTPDQFAKALGPAIFAAMEATFRALLTGLAVGSVLGFLARLFLPRGFKSRRSEAYTPPIPLQPFCDVLHLGEEEAAEYLVVAEGSPLAGLTLRDSELLHHYGAHVLGIHRGKDFISLPGGMEQLLAGDRLLVLVSKARFREVAALFKKRGGKE